jgi:transcriptional regulator with GAF, ATPase, and Fis domain
LGESFEMRTESLHAEVELLRSLTEVTRLVSESDPTKGTLDRLCGVAGNSLAGAEVGMSLGGAARELESGAASTERADRLDRAQRQAGEGPCLAALADQNPHEAHGPALEEQWPCFGAMAAEEGVRGVLAVPFLVEGQSRGALNVYLFEGDGIDHQARRLVHLLAEAAAAALANVALYRRSAELARNLSIAMESRAVIEQAKGLIIGQRSCTPDEAFSLLRRVSQDRNVKVRDLAVELVGFAMAGPGASPPPAHLVELFRLG